MFAAIIYPLTDVTSMLQQRTQHWTLFGQQPIDWTFIVAHKGHFRETSLNSLSEELLRNRKFNDAGTTTIIPTVDVFTHQKTNGTQDTSVQSILVNNPDYSAARGGKKSSELLPSLAKIGRQLGCSGFWVRLGWWFMLPAFTS